MADFVFTIQITIPEKKAPKLLAAYNWEEGGSNGTDPNPKLTPNDIRDREKARIINEMEGIYLRYVTWAAKQAAQNDNLGAS